MDIRVNNVLATLLIVFVSACSHTPPLKPLPPGGKIAGANSLSIIADSQIHNIWGMGVKQPMFSADLLSPVAIRPPELNILAPFVLEDLIKQMDKNKEASLMLVLGDSTNVACSGEFNDFAGIMERARPGQPWLAVHGNHDTYLMGTINSYGPMAKDFQSEWLPQMLKSASPTDESWWGPSNLMNQGSSTFVGRNWKAACYRDVLTYDGETHESSPMNKIRWIAKYLKELEPHGLILPANTETSETSKIKINLTAQEGTALAAINYHVAGEWTKPDVKSNPNELNFGKSYSSFIVQSADVTPQHRLILIDTSVCESARGTDFKAGRKGCLGEDQLTIIGDILKATPRDKNLIFAGHFPLHELDDLERGRLINIMKSHGKWTYISGHTHDGIRAYEWNGGTDLNVGSTTDWPMEAHRFYLGKDSNEIAYRESFYNYYENGLKYVPTRRIDASEVCRHLPAAKALAELVPAEVRDAWESPHQDTSSCTIVRNKDWSDAEWNDHYSKKYSQLSDELRGHVDTIQARFRDPKEPEYRKIILRIAAAASERESKSFSLVDLLGIK